MDTETELAVSISRKIPALWSGSLYYLVTFLCAGSYMPFIYLYFSELGLTGEQVGWLSSLSPAMMILFATAIASFADRKRKRIIIQQIALVCTAIIFFLLQYPTTFDKIIALMLAWAIIGAPTMTLAEGLIARMAVRNKLNYGQMRMIGSFGYVVSTFGFGALWQLIGSRAMFTAAALFYLPLIWLAGQLEEGPVIPPKERQPATVLLRDAGLALLLLATFLASISNSLTMTFSGIYARSLGAGNFLVGAMIGGGAISEMPMMFFSERISKRLHRINTVLLSYVFMSLAYLGYILVKDPILLPFLTMVKGVGYGLWITVTIRMVTERTPEAWASTSQSLLTICMFGLAPLVAGPLGGWIHDVISPGAVFGLGILSLCLGGLVLLAAVKQKKL